jgi:hypothetical protein
VNHANDRNWISIKFGICSNSCAARAAPKRSRARSPVAAGSDPSAWGAWSGLAAWLDAWSGAAGAAE